MVDLAFNYQVAHFEKCIDGLDLIFKREINDSDHWISSWVFLKEVGFENIVFCQVTK